MKIYNKLDEKQRWSDFFATDEIGTQDDTHGFSYIQLRKYYQEMGDVRGLEKDLLEEGG